MTAERKQFERYIVFRCGHDSSPGVPDDLSSFAEFDAAKQDAILWTAEFSVEVFDCAQKRVVLELERADLEWMEPFVPAPTERAPCRAPLTAYDSFEMKSSRGRTTAAAWFTCAFGHRHRGNFRNGETGRDWSIGAEQKA